MDSSRLVSGKGPPSGPANPLSSSISPTWAENIGTVHMPQSQNVNVATGGAAVVNIITQRDNRESPRTTDSQHEGLRDSTARADYEIYSSQLLTQKRGFPLWVPGPGMQLPVEYRRQGVSIGDVGIITSTGEFDFLFNIFLPADHPINRGMVPQGFSPLPHQELERDIQRTAVYGPNTHLASTSVRKISAHGISETSIAHRFESTAEEAAILVLPHGATTQNLLNTWGVRFTISKKAKDWYTYARFTRGRDIRNGDIRVVVGIDKAPAWGIAISSCNIGQSASFVFKHEETHAYKYKWDCTGGNGRVGPLSVETHDLIEDNAVLQNQCVFVRTINFTLSGKTWSDFRSEAPGSGSGKLGRRDSASGNRRTSGGRHTSSGSGNSPSNHRALSKQRSSHSIRSVNFDRVEPGANHPSAELHKCLHEKFPHADMVITDDMAVSSDDGMVSPELDERTWEDHEPQNDWDIIHVIGNDDLKLPASSRMNPRKTERMRVRDGAGTPLIESKNRADDSPREGDEDTIPKISVDASIIHEPELLFLDPLQESILEVHMGDTTGCGIEPRSTSSSPETPSECPATVEGAFNNESGRDSTKSIGDASLSRYVIAPENLTIPVDTNDEDSLNNSRGDMHQLLPVESILNHDPPIEILEVTTNVNSQRISESGKSRYTQLTSPTGQLRTEHAQREAAPPALPELPAIENLDLRLQVLTHKDLRPTPPSEPEWGVNERLAALGASVLNKVVTLHFFSKHPPARAEELRTWRAQNTSPHLLNSWLDLYQLKQKFHVPPNQSDAIYNDLDQMATYFHSYIGAVFITTGLPAIQTWITRLIDADANIGTVTERNADMSRHASTSNGSSSGSPSSSPSTISLSSVNQMASQRRVSIAYVPSHEGPDHQPIWTIRCLINNAEKGVGVGRTKKSAKEEAGRQAWAAMGW